MCPDAECVSVTARSPNYELGVRIDDPEVKAADLRRRRDSSPAALRVTFTHKRATSWPSRPLPADIQISEGVTALCVLITYKQRGRHPSSAILSGLTNDTMAVLHDTHDAPAKGMPNLKKIFQGEPSHHTNRYDSQKVVYKQTDRLFPISMMLTYIGIPIDMRTRLACDIIKSQM